MKLPCFFLALSTTAAFAQGPLAPSAAPAPTQKSLQEIWDKLSAQQAQITSLQTQLTAVSGLNAVSAAGLTLPWNITTVNSVQDSVDYAGHFASLAFGPDGQPAISHQEWWIPGYYQTLKLSRFDGTSWILERSNNLGDGDRSNSPLTFTADGQPAIAYFQYSNRGLRYALFNGAEWMPIVATNSGYGRSLSLAIGPNGRPAVSYAPESGSGLYIARFDGTAWTTTLVDNVNVGSYYPKTSLAFGPDGQPAIAYQDSIQEDLKFARYNGTAWTVTTVDSAGTVGLSASLAFGPDGQPSIAYHDFTNTSVKLARFNGTAWVITTIDANQNPGEHTSLAFGPDGQPSVAYYEVDQRDLKFARFNGTAWISLTVDSTGDVGRYVSLAFGPDGQPALAYWDWTNNDLKFARKGIFPTGP